MEKIVFSAIAKDDSHTLAMDMNPEIFKPWMVQVSVIKIAMNILAPTVETIYDAFGIKMGSMMGPDGPSHD